MKKHGTILHETKNLHLFETADGTLEVRLHPAGATHSLILGCPKDRAAGERFMRRAELCPDKLRALYFV